MTDINKIERFAEIKAQMKELDAEAKKIQKELIEEKAGEKIKTSYGTLTLTSRVTYECCDKQKVFNTIGEIPFITACSITLPAVKKACGSVIGDELFEKGGFRVKSISEYYILRS